MTAEEARELSHGSMKHKGFFFKLRLNWMCGIINKKIENAAELGKTYLNIWENTDTARKYFPLIAEMYSKLGYVVGYNDGSMRITWDFKNYSVWEMEYFAKMENCTEWAVELYKEKESERKKKLKL